MKNKTYLGLLLLLFVNVSIPPCLAQENNLDKETEIVSRFFDLWSSDVPLGEADEKAFFSNLTDVRACLLELPEYKGSKTPIWSFLRKNKALILGSESRLEPLVYEAARPLDMRTKKYRSMRSVFVVINLKRQSATPPLLVIHFLFDGEEHPQLATAPVFIKTNASRSLYDFAHEKVGK